MNYVDIRDDLKTGDLVLFSGKGGISRWIKRFTRSEWSHCGLIVKFEAEDVVALFESTTLSDLTDMVSGKKREGVQLVSFSDRLRNYNGKVAVRRLAVPLNEEQLAEFHKFRREFARVHYERSYWELLKAGLGWNRTEDLSSVFCSELCAEGYQRFGLLGESPASNSYTPKTLGGSLLLQGNSLRGALTIERELARPRR